VNYNKDLLVSIVTCFEIIPTPEPKTREEFLQCKSLLTNKHTETKQVLTHSIIQLLNKLHIKHKMNTNISSSIQILISHETVLKSVK